MTKLKLSIKALVLSLLTGCASFDAPLPVLKEPEHNKAILVIYQDNRNLIKNNQDPTKDKILGRAYINRKVNTKLLPTWIDACYISVLEYPKAMGHEITHCFSGDFHNTPETEIYKYTEW